MVRQCAWCLRLINSVGERTSTLPVPKMYEASHGICQVCGLLWLEAVEGSNKGALVITRSEDGRQQVRYEEEAVPPMIASLLR
jgi:hypothetical protein